MVCTFKNPLIHKIVSLIVGAICTCEEKSLEHSSWFVGRGCKVWQNERTLGINALDF